MIASSTLVLRETLLGALKARLENDRLMMLHASDFHTAVEQLGLNFGSRDVDDIMVLCKVSSSLLIAPHTHLFLSPHFPLLVLS